MADCRHCGGNVSPNAKTCPHCGEPDPSCFPGDVRILTPFGYRRIESLVCGETILSWNLLRRSLSVRPITKILSHPLSRIWSVEFASNRPPLRATRFHTILTERGWVRVDRIVKGDCLVVGENTRQRKPQVLKVLETSQVECVYNLVTEGEHNFIVENLVAHNFTFFRGLRTLTHQIFIDKTASSQSRTRAFASPQRCAT